MTSTDRITRGTLRLFHELGFAAMCELPLTNGRRADVVGLCKNGRVAIAEVKSCVADFRSDQKWQNYLPYSDEFYFAVDAEFPLRLLDEEASLPDRTGIIVADAYGGEIMRPALPCRVHASRRKTLHLKMARAAAHRLIRPIVAGPTSQSAMDAEHRR